VARNFFENHQGVSQNGKKQRKKADFLFIIMPFLTDFIEILQMFIIWGNDNLSKISGKLERVP